MRINGRLLFAAVAVVVAAGWNYQQSKQIEGLSGLALANVEALANSEGGSGSGYCTIHIQCYDNYGNPTGKYSASSYPGPTCNGPSHRHTCSLCSHV